MFTEIRQFVELSFTCSGVTSTAKYQRPVQWDGSSWVLDKDHLAECETAPENVADDAIHSYDVESIMRDVGGYSPAVSRLPYRAQWHASQRL